MLRPRALWRGSQGPQPFCTLSASASSARVSAQPRYCFHMFLQETSGVRSLVGMLTGYVMLVNKQQAASESKAQ